VPYIVNWSVYHVCEKNLFATVTERDFLIHIYCAVTSRNHYDLHVVDNFACSVKCEIGKISSPLFDGRQICISVHAVKRTTVRKSQ